MPQNRPESNSPSVENVLPWLRDTMAAGLKSCLATLLYADGSSPRPRGSQMAVAADGSFFGYLTGGCAEAAIADEALRAIAGGANSVQRFGIGSPYLDIRLPCGAGIDIWFDQAVGPPLVDQVLAGLERREAVCIETSVVRHGPATRLVRAGNDPLVSSSFRRWYHPQRRLHVIGAGPIVFALASIAASADYEVRVLTPDAQTLATVATELPAQQLHDVSQIRALDCDPYTAVVLLFHEHERETEILRHFLATDVYYIGALGSRQTQAIRLELLEATGVDAASLARIRGPVGLDIQARTPGEIAVSILAEMTAEYQAAGRPLLDWSGGALTLPRPVAAG